MPTYEYACRDCGHTFDVVQSFSEDALTVCPSCQGHLRKVFSAAGIIFKGSGYYVTDSRTAPAAGKTSGDGESPDVDKKTDVEKKTDDGKKLDKVDTSETSSKGSVDTSSGSSPASTPPERTTSAEKTRRPPRAGSGSPSR